MAQEVTIQSKYNLPRMKSMERISKLPAVEQTVDIANNLYVKVKDTNNLMRSVLTTAETTVKGAVDITMPVTAKFERPIRLMDSFLCSSLDFVENKIPAVKLPLDEMYRTTRDSLYTIPGVKCACQAGEQGVKKAVEIAYGATQYGTQKIKSVKDCLTLPPLNPEDPKSTLAVQYSINAKRLLSMFFSWLWITKPHISGTKTHSYIGENSVGDKKEPEASSGLVLNRIKTGVYTGEEKENHVPNHTKSD